MSGDFDHIEFKPCHWENMLLVVDSYCKEIFPKEHSVVTVFQSCELDACPSRFGKIGSFEDMNHFILETDDFSMRVEGDISMREACEVDGEGVEVCKPAYMEYSGSYGVVQPDDNGDNNYNMQNNQHATTSIFYKFPSSPIVLEAKYAVNMADAYYGDVDLDGDKDIVLVLMHKGLQLPGTEYEYLKTQLFGVFVFYRFDDDSFAPYEHNQFTESGVCVWPQDNPLDGEDVVSEDVVGGDDDGYGDYSGGGCGIGTQPMPGFVAIDNAIDSAVGGALKLVSDVDDVVTTEGFFGMYGTAATLFLDGASGAAERLWNKIF